MRHAIVFDVIATFVAHQVSGQMLDLRAARLSAAAAQYHRFSHRLYFKFFLTHIGHTPIIFEG